ncbi:hypothetical protein PHLCEN_2v5675 [Hermanssonia centrifuga]|uniref:Uncharacterized protein n=1 Tax=Hermanssonia centrifuga TaxID=98765 RepID=A0A2R6P1U9_9APHY|nr:hypothetical protein PHLCEN_2v5675 [Hermanssonia centrifuga]
MRKDSSKSPVPSTETGIRGLASASGSGPRKVGSNKASASPLHHILTKMARLLPSPANIVSDSFESE